MIDALLNKSDYWVVNANNKEVIKEVAGQVKHAKTARGGRGDALKIRFERQRPRSALFP